MSGEPVSVRKLKVRVMIPTKMADCWVINREAKVSPITMPIYFARSPSSIFKAMKLTSSHVLSCLLSGFPAKERLLMGRRHPAGEGKPPRPPKRSAGNPRLCPPHSCASSSSLFPLLENFTSRGSPACRQLAKITRILPEVRALFLAVEKTRKNMANSVGGLAQPFGDRK